MNIKLDKHIDWKCDIKGSLKDKIKFKNGTIELGENWKETENKYKEFYEYIKHLLRNANLDEKLVREKIKEIENLENDS